MLTYTDIQLNREIAPIQWGYTPAGFYARHVLPVVQVKEPTGQYPKGTAAHLRYIKSPSEGTAPAPRVDIGLSMADYKCTPHDRDAFVQDFLSRQLGDVVALNAAQMAQDSLLVEEERDLAAALNTASNYTATNKATPTTLWDAANADPFGGTNGVKAGLTYLYAKNGNRINDIVMYVTPDVDLVLADYVRATTPQAGYALPDAATMARYFRVREYVVLASAYNSALPGQPDTLTGCWGTRQCWLVNNPSDQTVLTPSFGKTIVDVPGSRVRHVVSQNPLGDSIILTNCYDQETIDWTMIYWIKDCVSA